MPPSYRPPSRNLGDSRRSPRDSRDQSPARYNDRNERSDRDEYRGGAHTSERRRSIPDIRSNNNAFNSNRDTFREPMGREPPRDFPPRETPRGPRTLIDAPTGPRASSYGSDYRGDRGDYGYRGDYRDRGRGGRGRGWRDDSRDRARDLDRIYRRDRDDRGPPHFRDEPGRERWAREPYNNRGRRPVSPPQGRARSPTYVPRDSRDAPLPNIEVDHARRGSRDGPLSGGSPASDGVPFSRGGFQGRSTRGRGPRGRGSYYDDHRRTRSPEPSWSRRTQPSATPPPQVPAFGSNLSASGPIPGVAVPTAPRYERVIRRSHGHATSSVNLIIDNSKKDDVTDTSQPHRHSPSVAPKDLQTPMSQEDCQKESEAKALEESPKATAPVDPKRKPVIGKRQPKVIIPDASDIEDSGDDLDDSYFEEEIAKVKKQIEQIEKDNPLMPREDPEAPYLKPFMDANIDEVPTSTKLAAPKPCVAPEIKQEAPPLEPTLPLTKSMVEPPNSMSLPRPTSKGKSRPTTPLAESNAISKPQDIGAQASEPSSLAVMRAQQKEAVISPWNPTAFLSNSGPSGNSSARASVSAQSPRSMKQSMMETDTPMLDAAPLPSLVANVDEVMRDSTPPSRQAHAAVAPEIEMRDFSEDVKLDLNKLDPPVQPRGTTQPHLSINSSISRRSSATPSHIAGEASRDTSGDMLIAAPKPRKPVMETFSDDEDDDSNPITAEELELVRPYMRTPPISSLPKFNCKPFWEDKEFLASMDKEWEDFEMRNKVQASIAKDRERVEREQAEERERIRVRQVQYRQWTDFSQDEVAVKSREKFAKSRAKAASEAAAPHPSASTSSNSKPEGRHRTGSRWATEHDFERVLRESEQEAKDKKSRDDKEAREKTANAKEATIPDMCWDDEEWDKTAFTDKSGLVPFDRSFARLEFGEPVDDFTEEECKIFEEIYMDNPKQFSKIAEHLPGRDYKECIQHYYNVKWKSNLKQRQKKAPKKRKPKAKGKNPKSNALMADLGILIRDELDEGQEAENGERRRPRRAAAPTWPFETPASESEVASPAPTPSRKPAATKGDTNNDAPPTKRKTKTPREKGTKQPKNNQLLAAAPSTTTKSQPESPVPTMPETEWKIHATPAVTPRQYDGMSQYDGPSQSQSILASTPAPAEKPLYSLPANPEIVPQPPQPIYAQQERLASAPPSGFEQQPDRRSIQQTSSYWSVPEQTEFPALLKHFGTDWHGIAKHMTSKTHIMVYTNLFDKWLAVPSDTNKSRLSANIQTQVKNYYQRQVDSGKMKEWEDFTREADARKERGEKPPDLPPSTMLPKRRYDLPSGTLQRSGSSMDIGEDLTPVNQSKVLSRPSPPQPSLSSRFPTLAQAGPVPHIQPATPTSVLNKHLPPQPIQQASQQVQQAQQVQQPPRPARAPPLGYFTQTQNEPRDLRDQPRDPRPLMQANTSVSERSLMVAQEAQAERQRAESAIRLQREQQREQTDQQREQQAAMQREQQLQQQQALQQQQQQQQQQQAQKRERQFQMKQEPETTDLRQFEAFASPGPQMHAGSMAQSRPEPPKVIPSSGPEQRRTTTAPPHQFQPRHHPRTFVVGENLGGMREIKSTPLPTAPRPPMSAPPTTQEQYSAPPASLQHPVSQHHQQMPQPPPQVAAPIKAAPQPVAPARPQETVRKTSSIMSLLNSDEPSDPRPTPAKRVSDVSSSALQPSRTPPPPQHSLQGSRYSAHPPPSNPQTSQMSQQMGVQPPVPQQAQPPPSQHSYGQPSPHPMHQHSSSIGHSRSYTPTGFDRGGYGQTPTQQPQNLQQMYSQPPPRSTMTSQPPPIRREQSMGDLHGVPSGYARASAPSQSRLKESPYSQSQPTPPPQTQTQRSAAGSPLDLAPSAERDYYSRQQQASYFIQQQSATSSPQPGTYHPQPLQQSQPSHRQLAFGQSPAHVASPPPPQYAGSHHRSRGNSFDGRLQMSTSAPGPASQGYVQAPQHQQTPPAGPSLSMQYQQQHQGLERYESLHERERRIQLQQQQQQEEEAYFHQKRVDEQRRMAEARR